MTTLNTQARETLARHGIPVAEWSRQWFTDGRWHGDACGCPDDRCIGYHHEADDDCDLIYWLADYLAQDRPARAVRGSRVALHSRENPTHIIDDGDLPGFPFTCLTCGARFAN